MPTPFKSFRDRRARLEAEAAVDPLRRATADELELYGAVLDQGFEDLETVLTLMARHHGVTKAQYVAAARVALPFLRATRQGMRQLVETGMREAARRAQEAGGDDGGTDDVA